MVTITVDTDEERAAVESALSKSRTFKHEYRIMVAPGDGVVRGRHHRVSAGRDAFVAGNDQVVINRP